MSSDVTKIGKKAVNRIVVGILFMIIFGLVGGLAIFLLQVPLTGDVRDLATGIEAIDTNIVSGLAIIFWFAVSTLAIAGIATFVVAKLRFLQPFKGVDKEPDLPRKTSIVTYIILGAIISFLFWVTNQLLGLFGTQLSAVDIAKIGESIVSGQLAIFAVGLIFALIAGSIVVAVVNRSTSFQKAGEDVGLPNT